MKTLSQERAAPAAPSGAPRPPGAPTGRSNGASTAGGADGPASGGPPGPPTGGLVAACLDIVAAALHEVAGARCWSVSDTELGDLVGRAFVVQSQVHELVLRLVAEAEGRDLPRQAGATSTGAWLADTGRLSRSQAGGLARLAAAVSGRYEQTRQALAGGQLSVEQARVICLALDDLRGQVKDLTDQERDEAERWLIDQAHQHGPDELRRLGRRVFEVLSPRDADRLEGDLLADQEERAWQHCSFTMRRCGDGTTRGAFRLPDAQADMLKAALEAMSSPRRWASTHQPAPPPDPAGSPSASASASPADRPTEDPVAGPVDEPLPAYGVRMGQALAQLVEHLPTDVLPQHGGISATVVVTIDNEALRTGTGAATLSTGTRISAGQARRWACGAGILPAVLDGASTVLDLGRSSRLFSIKQRIALGIAQGGCCWAGCDRPPGWCEAHHGRCPWDDGGLTDLADGILLCSWHHHLAHGGEWTVRFGPDDIPEVIPPARIDPQRRPRRHTRFRPRE